MKFRFVSILVGLPLLVVLVSCVDDDTGGDEGPCVPLACADRNRECGVMSDGCGTLLNCGDCDDGFRCNIGNCEEVCIPDCAGKCSGADDGCNGLCTDNCPLTGQTCEKGECVGDCVPRTCHAMGFDCGEHDDWCGGTVECGECLTGSECKSGLCSAVEATGLGDDCRFEDNCADPFPTCMKLAAETSFCTKECTADGQCGSGTSDEGTVTNCCVPIGDKSWCFPAAPDDNLMAGYFCDDPTDGSWCTNYETCLPSPNGACVFCFAVGDQIQLGETCDAFNSCDKELACVKLSGEDTSTCREICDPSDVDACVADDQVRHCLGVAELGSWGVCVDGAAECDPSRLGEGCPTGWNCVPATDASTCPTFACAKAGAKQVGETCAEYDQCARGAYCADGTCREMCSVSNGCPDSYECVQGCSTKIKYCKEVDGGECNPLLPDWLCLAGQTCVPDSLADCSAGTCYLPGTVAVGGGCTTQSDCVYNAMCYNNICRRLCSLTNTCPNLSLCTFVCGGQDLGVCIS